MKNTFTKLFCLVSLLISQSVFSQTPTFNWAHSFSSDFITKSSAVDANGNYYLAFNIGDGWGNTNMDPNGTNYLNVINGQWISALVKYDSNGSLVWIKNFGHQSTNAQPGVEIKSMKLSTSGDIYLTGIFSGTFDFDLGPNTFTLSSPIVYNAFVLKLDNNGDFSWVKSLNTTNGTDANQITLDANNDVIVAGTFSGTQDLDPTLGTSTLTSQNNRDVYIIKLNASGNFLYAKNFGSAYPAGPVITDASNNIYVTGRFHTSLGDFDPNAGVSMLTNNGGSDVFIVKLNSAGNFINANSFGASLDDNINDLTIDNSGNITLCGIVAGTSVDMDPTVNTFTYNIQGGSDSYIMQLNSSGNLNWVNFLNGIGSENAFTLSQNSNEIVLGGDFSGALGVVSTSTVSVLSNTLTAPEADGFIMSFSNSGQYNWANNFNCAGIFSVKHLNISSLGEIYSSGFFYGTADFDFSATTNTLTSLSQFLFIAKYNGSLATSVQQLDASTQFNVYPNPNNGEFTIQSKMADVVNITNELGQIIETIELNQQNNFSYKVSQLSSGIYFLVGKTIKQKVVVTK
jgi:hypothetical protein